MGSIHHQLTMFWLIIFYMLVLHTHNKGGLFVEGIGCNWGTRATHPLPPDVTVRLMKDNGFGKVKLFEAEPWVMQALGRSGLEVMLGIPNEFLAPLAASVQAAENWVMQNVSNYISKHGVDIRYVAVGNEPFLKSYKGMFQNATFPAMQNIQAALIKAGLGRQVKVTVPLNADVYESLTGLPSNGDFRADIHDLMMSIVRFLQESNYPITINIYPFLSLNADPNFPKEYAFFTPGSSSPIVDGAFTYTNVFDANYDTLIAALEKNGFGSMEVIVGEIGWPTDGDKDATVENARRFNQGLLDRVSKNKGTPRKSTPPDIYIFGLIDEDAKSIQPGNFERHWGMFYYDGTVKYDILMPDGQILVPAKGVRYLERQWCVLSPTASIADPAITDSVNYACQYSDCTSLGYGSTCNMLDVRSNISYAFNQYFQSQNQQKGSCGFSNLSVITKTDPSEGTCRFEVMIDIGKHDLTANVSSHADKFNQGAIWRTLATVVFGLLLWSR
ncbi:hypothetical protein LUZ61_000844 [Rhynchospora tenuis]|uniref:glucan endo-1,3-beta-D-glucosidase n=1 Tax=Rhynchospora tenuis TaxID=198213 RepID=A0AAD5ZGA9_9POAL|nr:hypothetical protein LUZ61_000844 [Rhynchospora tenuis]